MDVTENLDATEHMDATENLDTTEHMDPTENLKVCMDATEHMLTDNLWGSTNGRRRSALAVWIFMHEVRNVYFLKLLIFWVSMSIFFDIFLLKLDKKKLLKLDI